MIKNTPDNAEAWVQLVPAGKILHASRQLSLCTTLLSPGPLEPTNCNKRSHHKEKPFHPKEE